MSIAVEPIPALVWDLDFEFCFANLEIIHGVRTENRCPNAIVTAYGYLLRLRLDIFLDQSQNLK